MKMAYAHMVITDVNKLFFNTFASVFIMFVRTTSNIKRTLIYTGTHHFFIIRETYRYIALGISGKHLKSSSVSFFISERGKNVTVIPRAEFGIEEAALTFTTLVKCYVDISISLYLESQIVTSNKRFVSHIRYGILKCKYILYLLRYRLD